MSAGIEITVGEHTAKIYEITNRGNTAFQVSFYKAGERQRLTFTKLAKAKAEARIALGKIGFDQPGGPATFHPGHGGTCSRSTAP